MDIGLLIFILAVMLSYAYAFTGGFTDAANAIATSVATRALSPAAAVLMAGLLEIAGAMAGTAVALTIGKGIVSLELLSLTTVLAALLGVMTWSMITYYFGIPVSETHGLLGGIIGAATAAAGFKVILWNGVGKVLLAILISPLLGFLGGVLLMGIINRLFHLKNARKMNRLFKNLQRLSSAFMAFSHGLNDAQKPMGILVMILAIHYGWKDPTVPFWVIITVGLTASLGVAYGGWRIIKTMGMKIAPLSTEQGFAAETAAAGVLQLASFIGIPVSTTHTITSSIVGAGVARRFSSVNWGIAAEIALSWVLTLPATICLAWFYSKIISLIVE
ncbi:anion permease [Fibrobacterota bacterium]